MLTLLAAMWAGLVRLGWVWPVWQLNLPALHGPLMISGFLGTLIGLERAVALAKRWAYWAPFFSGLGALWLLAGWPGWPGPLLITLGSGVLLLSMAQIVRIQPALFTVTISLGVLSWLVSNLLWLAGWPPPLLVLWWMGFLILTIAGERLELSRLLRPSPTAYLLFVVSIFLLIAGMAVSLDAFALGTRMAGLSMAALALWLLWYDIARRRLKAGGQAQFIAVSLLSGYIWLAVGGLLALVYGGVMAGPYYDALLHAVFLGFVFTMIFAHAPIIFPAILQLPVNYRPRFYTHLALLHGTLLLRIGSDLLHWQPGRQWGGLLNAVVLLLFLFNMVSSLRASGQQA
jgi:hypothetical protein